MGIAGANPTRFIYTYWHTICIHTLLQLRGILIYILAHILHNKLNGNENLNNNHSHIRLTKNPIIIDRVN